MRKSTTIILILVTVIAVLSYTLGSCRKNENPNALTYFTQDIPPGFPAPLYRFADNPLSREGVELGRKLFYDGALSIDGVHPCSSCHQQIAAFGTFEHDRSHGVYSSHTLRNAPVLFNLAWQKDFHWDGEFSSLFAEAAQPVNGHTEMGESFSGVIDRLEKDPDYVKMFKNVFRTEFISPEYILKALAQFTGTLTSFNSKYDRYKRGEASYTVSEESGYQLFLAHCTTCHPPPMFTDYSFRNIGLPIDPFLNDFGRMRVTKKLEDSLRFRVPTLRNVYISSNYMHDGRFATLSQVMTHYRTGIQQSQSLDPLLKTGITMTDADAVNIALFLRTLTDSSILTDTRLSKP
ncbi:MAG TPA: cytochrome c peroxidase [Chitinophagaceae bacterium]|nr:cytochrome c peroxidase [Chitinophagaceae bacterium]